MDGKEDADIDGSLEEQGIQPVALQSRAYQIEMLEQAMRQNVIVAMDTGSGKTQIARLRIEAELERSSEKRVWFCAPSVVLARQQHVFLSSCLPTYQTRLITGLDNVEYWSTQDVWDAVLEKIDIVVSTPQILLDALSHGFVSLERMSLLIFDEAHHCIGNEPMALIMSRFYHRLKFEGDASHLPHVLGLTASPITNKPTMLNELEKNMNAVCKTPTLQIQDYMRHVFMPTLERISFAFTLDDSFRIVKLLDSTVAKLTVQDDPTVKWLQSRDRGLRGSEKLKKILSSGRTPVMKQMGSFLGHAQHICDNIGRWAAELYIRSCASKLHEGVTLHESIVPTLAAQEQQYVDAKLQMIVTTVPRCLDDVPVGALVAPKAQAVIDYLLREYRPGITAIIFVKRRSIAFALTQLLQHHPLMRDYNVFSFVGVANPAHRSLIDLTDMQLQNEAFADFQAGRRNVCVATQVMEEGVDVQATNLVIRFDEPENFRSFVQSRGRARRPDSKFVMVHPAEDSNSTRKVRNWKELEQMMKELYSDLERNMVNMEEVEQEYEEGDEVYTVPETGALLTYDNAQQHLAHFASTLPREENGDPAHAIVIISGEPFKPKSAKIILPSSVPPSLQVTSSLRTWRTERMARKDAAFQTYRSLHSAKLVNDNLLPYPRARKVSEKIEGRDSTCEVDPLMDPWTYLTNDFEESSYIHFHCIDVSGKDFALPRMTLLLPVRLDTGLTFVLNSDILGPMSVEIEVQESSASGEPDLAHEITHHLFTAILGRRLKKMNQNVRLPYLIFPEIAQSDMSTWLEHARSSTKLSTITFNETLNQGSYLLKHKREEILYMWKPQFDSCVVKQYSSEEVITAERLSKQLSYLDDSQHSESNVMSVPDVRLLAVDDCTLQTLPAAYGKFMLLMPSISYMLAVALRGQLATGQGPLAGIGFSNSSFVSRALTSSSALSMDNYESLEFIGDSLLKYYACTQVFFEFPQLTEAGLNAKYAAISNNARLQRAAKELALDKYINVERFSGQKWTLSATSDEAGQRQMSTKTLADVIEALVGAAYLDPANNPDKDRLPISALSHILSEVAWKSPVAHIADFHHSALVSNTSVTRLEDIECMLGYQFEHRSLLLEAITKSTLHTGSQSYQRLEFLGDAVLDRLVNVALYDSSFGHDPENLKYRRDALANRWILAFLAMNTHHVVVTNDVQTKPSGQPTITPEPKVCRLVDHMRSSLDQAERLQRQKAETTFLEAHETIHSALESGQKFPWVALHSINTSKSYSDIIEAILAAVFIDSGGSLPTCERVLDKLGLLKILHRLATDPDVEVRQPIVMLGLMYPGCDKVEKHTGTYETNTKKWRCTLSFGGQEIANERSDVSRKHAEALAAETALEWFRTRELEGKDSVMTDD